MNIVLSLLKTIEGKQSIAGDWTVIDNWVDWGIEWTLEVQVHDIFV